MTTTYQRDNETVRASCGVRIAPGHGASASVHAFRTWTGEATLATWCGLDVDLGDQSRLTKDLVSCRQCAQASKAAFWRGRDA